MYGGARRRRSTLLPSTSPGRRRSSTRRATAADGDGEGEEGGLRYASVEEMTSPHAGPDVMSHDEEHMRSSRRRTQMALGEDQAASPKVNSPWFSTNESSSPMSSRPHNQQPQQQRPSVTTTAATEDDTRKEGREGFDGDEGSRSQQQSRSPISPHFAAFSEDEGSNGGVEPPPELAPWTALSPEGMATSEPDTSSPATAAADADDRRGTGIFGDVDDNDDDEDDEMDAAAAAEAFRMAASRRQSVSVRRGSMVPDLVSPARLSLSGSATFTQDALATSLSRGEDEDGVVASKYETDAKTFMKRRANRRATVFSAAMRTANDDDDAVGSESGESGTSSTFHHDGGIEHAPHHPNFSYQLPPALKSRDSSTLLGKKVKVVGEDGDEQPPSPEKPSTRRRVSSVQDVFTAGEGKRRRRKTSSPSPAAPGLEERRLSASLETRPTADRPSSFFHRGTADHILGQPGVRSSSAADASTSIDPFSDPSLGITRHTYAARVRRVKEQDAGMGIHRTQQPRRRDGKNFTRASVRRRNDSKLQLDEEEEEQLQEEEKGKRAEEGRLSSVHPENITLNANEMVILEAAVRRVPLPFVVQEFARRIEEYDVRGDVFLFVPFVALFTIFFLVGRDIESNHFTAAAEQRINVVNDGDYWVYQAQQLESYFRNDSTPWVSLFRSDEENNATSYQNYTAGGSRRRQQPRRRRGRTRREEEAGYACGTPPPVGLSDIPFLGDGEEAGKAAHSPRQEMWAGAGGWRMQPRLLHRGSDTLRRRSTVQPQTAEAAPSSSRRAKRKYFSQGGNSTNAPSARGMDEGALPVDAADQAAFEEARARYPSLFPYEGQGRAKNLVDTGDEKSEIESLWMRQESLFLTIRSGPQWIKWVREVFTPLTWDCANPDHSHQATTRRRGQTALLGGARIRVLRVLPNSCTFNPFFTNRSATNKTNPCYAMFDRSVIDESDFCNKPNPTMLNETMFRYHRCPNLAVTYRGERMLYPCDGHAVTLPFNATCRGIRELVQMMTPLASSNTTSGASITSPDPFSYPTVAKRSLDPTSCESFALHDSTRMVMLEYFAYSLFSNTFLRVKALCEITESGTWIPNYTTRVFAVWSPTAYLAWTIFDFIFFATVLYFVRKFIIDWMLSKRTTGKWLPFLLDVWNLMELVNLVTFVVSISFKWVWWNQSRGFQITFNVMPFYPEDLDQVEYVYSSQIFANSINVVLTYLKVLKYLRLNDRLNVLSRTLAICQSNVIVILFLFVYLDLGYAFAGTIIFGSSIREFKNLNTALSTLFFALLGQFDYEGWRAKQPELTGVYFWSFVFLGYFIFLNFITAMLGDGFSQTVRGTYLQPLSEVVLRQLDEIRLILTRGYLKEFIRSRFSPRSRGDLLRAIHDYLRDHLELHYDSTVSLGLRPDPTMAYCDFHYWIPVAVLEEIGPKYLGVIWEDIVYEYYNKAKSSSSFLEKEAAKLTVGAAVGEVLEATLPNISALEMQAELLVDRLDRVPGLIVRSQRAFGQSAATDVGGGGGGGGGTSGGDTQHGHPQAMFDLASLGMLSSSPGKEGDEEPTNHEVEEEEEEEDPRQLSRAGSSFFLGSSGGGEGRKRYIFGDPAPTK